MTIASVGETRGFADSPAARSSPSPVACCFADRAEWAAAVRVQMTDLFQKLLDGDREESTRESWQRVRFTPPKAK